jgi:hypothetical protein
MQRLAIIAGGGGLPAEIARRLDGKGQLAGIIGVGTEPAGVSEFPIRVLNFGQLGALWRQLRNWNAEGVIFAGGVTDRPEFSILKMDLGTIKSLPRLVSILAAGDDAVLRGAADIFRDQGFPVFGFAEIIPELLPKAGLLGHVGLNDSQRNDLEDAFRISKGLGALDCGQASVVERGRAIALEAAEGTDLMLQRVIALRRDRRVSQRGGGVLVKCAKPAQDLRFDLPTIGLDTLKMASEAGISAIGLEAGRSIILDQKRVVETANTGGIALYAFPSDRDSHVSRNEPD